jgi:starch synthase
MTAKLQEALLLFADRERWSAMMLEAMGRDLSWKASAERYAELYHNLLG